jgi:hypothetical protein
MISEGVNTLICWSTTVLLTAERCCWSTLALLRGEVDGEGVLVEELEDCVLGKGEDGSGVTGEAADEEHTSKSRVVLLVGVVVCGGGVVIVADFIIGVLAAALVVVVGVVVVVVAVVVGFFSNGGVTEVTTIAEAAAVALGLRPTMPASCLMAGALAATPPGICGELQQHQGND